MSDKISMMQLYETLSKYTDEEHPMETGELIRRLKNKGVSYHRATLYRHIKELNESGYEVMTVKKSGETNKYFVAERELSTPELRVIIDALCGAAFLSPNKTKSIVEKVASLNGERKAELIKRNTVIYETVKRCNENVVYNINEIEYALEQKQKVSFYYFDLNIKGEKEFRKDKKRYIVTPLTLMMDGQSYYLVCSNAQFKSPAAYRVDRMEGVRAEDEIGELPEKLKNFDAAEYKQKVFGMFAGRTELVTFEASNNVVERIYDKFGEKIEIMPLTKDKFAFSQEVMVSEVFYSWCLSFGEKLIVKSPESVVEGLKEKINSLSLIYK